MQQNKKPKITIYMFSGKIGAGKDEACTRLNIQKQFQQFAFANELKERAMKDYGLTRKQVFVDKKEPIPHLPFHLTGPYENFCFATIGSFLTNLKTVTYTTQQLNLDPKPIKEISIFADKIPDIKLDNVSAKFDQERIAVEIYKDKDTNRLYVENGFGFYQGLHWTPRAILIVEGNVKRTVNINFWVDQVFDQIIKSFELNHQTKFCISDFRFPNEYFRLIERALQHQQVSNVNIDIVPIRLARNEKTSTSTDESEVALDNFQQFKIRIENENMSLTEFHQYIDQHL